MPRAKGGFKTRQRRKKWLKLAKGFRGVNHSVYKKAREVGERSLAHAYRGRKQKKRDFRRLWIVRINAAARQHGLSYSKLISLLKKNNIEIDRKALSELAVNNPEEFEQLVKQVSA
ncbi:MULTISPECIES: 50S ribosomal protein L20 [Flexistipes]|uniref:Large ribosomal subunit protein bL20 n=4 Tax=Flexistipes sinusarabici TaxID=2352 RepID=F8E9V4_FLESM|nr:MULTISPECIES: 50S ribosomal protein L20 [Flexistipes]AEI15365.1 50S ribosomal protein L20 [Flexistipes sinusarabici DSM 4947]MEC9492066.1 50S ribosomal protein L20 [Flexistipes sp.]TYB32863.1 MAG: 50S ribosomal protein L20 [Flexistipes sinusarabici]